MSALKVVSGFHTVSYEAIGVTSSGIIPDVIGIELRRVYGSIRIIGRTLSTGERREERQKSLDE